MSPASPLFAAPSPSVCSPALCAYFLFLFWFVPGVLQVVQLGYGILHTAGKSYPLERLANGWGEGCSGAEKFEWSLIVLLTLWERRENFTTAERRKTLSAFSAKVISEKFPPNEETKDLFLCSYAAHPDFSAAFVRPAAQRKSLLFSS